MGCELGFCKLSSDTSLLAEGASDNGVLPLKRHSWWMIASCQLPLRRHGGVTLRLLLITIARGRTCRIVSCSPMLHGPPRPRCCGRSWLLMQVAAALCLNIMLSARGSSMSTILCSPMLHWPCRPRSGRSWLVMHRAAALCLNIMLPARGRSWSTVICSPMLSRKVVVVKRSQFSLAAVAAAAS